MSIISAFERPLVAFDGSTPSLRALDAAVRLAAQLGVDLHLVMVVDSLPSYFGVEAIAVADARTVEDCVQQGDEATNRELQAAKSSAAQAGVTLHIQTREGDAIDGIIAAIESVHADLLIVGLRHHAGLIERLVPQTAQTLTERSPCSVLGVR